MNDQARNVSPGTLPACPSYARFRWTHKQAIAMRHNVRNYTQFSVRHPSGTHALYSVPGLRPIPVTKDDTLDRIFALWPGQGHLILRRFPERFGKLLHDTLGPRFCVSWSMPGSACPNIFVSRRTAKDLKAREDRAAIQKARRTPDALTELRRAEEVEESWGL